MFSDKIALQKIALPKVVLPKACLAGHSESGGYIKDGLVFWLDGIDKGPTEGKWTDLVGGMEFSPIGAVEWGSDYVRGMLEANENVYSPYDGSTSEGCYTADSPLPILVLLLWPGAASLRGICTGFAHGGFIINRKPNIMNWCDNSYYQYVGGHTFSCNMERLCQNGLLAHALRVEGWVDRGGNARVDYTDCGAKVHSLRIYNRLLNEEEMRHNQEVDRRRFNLVFPEPASTLELSDEDYEDYSEPRGNGVYPD